MLEYVKYLKVKSKIEFSTESKLEGEYLGGHRRTKDDYLIK